MLRHWDESARGEHYDFAVHIGMAGAEKIYRLEKRAHRDGYTGEDLNGEYPDPDDPVWDGLPSVLETDVDVEDVVARWKNYCQASRNYDVSRRAVSESILPSPEQTLTDVSG